MSERSCGASDRCEWFAMVEEAIRAHLVDFGITDD